MTVSTNDSLHLFIVLSRASQWMNAHADRDIRRLGLNRTEFGVLELLYHKGPQPLQRIGEKILMTSGNITYVLDKLVRKGLAVRTASTEDRRVFYAEITDGGRVLIEQCFPDHIEAIAAAAAGLLPEEKRQAIALLKKLGHAAEQSFRTTTARE